MNNAQYDPHKSAEYWRTLADQYEQQAHWDRSIGLSECTRGEDPRERQARIFRDTAEKMEQRT